MTVNMIVPLEVGIAVRDLPKMRRFYEEVLGFAFVNEVTVPPTAAIEAALHRDGYTVVRLQTSRGERIKLLAPATPPAPAPVPEFILEKPNASYLTFIVDNIEAVIGQLATAGARLLTGPQRVEVRPGTWLAFCHDPEGNVLEIVQYDDIAAYRPDLHPTEAP